MQRYLLFFVALTIFVPILTVSTNAQTDPIFDDIVKKTTKTAGVKLIPKEIWMSKAAGADFERRELFLPNARRIASDEALAASVVKGTIIVPDRRAISAVISEKPEFITLALPKENGTHIELELRRTDILASGFKVSTSSPSPMGGEESYGLHYRGIVKGDEYSLAAISIFPGEIVGSIRSKTLGNGVLGRLEGPNPNSSHIFYDANDLTATQGEFCNVRDSGGNNEPLRFTEQQDDALAVKRVRIYFEANYDLFQNKGSVPNTVAYVTAFFNQMAVLYANDGIYIGISEIFVWTSPSPYTATTTSTELVTFRTTRTSFNGDLAHLLTMTNYGGRAYLDVICNFPFRYGVSGIYASFNNVPTWSWTVSVVAHELGHNLGSPHTHACQWNGNNTAIDGCYTVEGSCSQPSLPTGGGTIMSYCHLLPPIGINFNLGFGTQPTALMQNRIAAAPCIASSRNPQFDFDGDGKSDVGVFRPGVGEWWYLRSSDQQARGFQFGAGTDVPVPGDHTGDGKADIAFYRPSSGEWYILRSEDSTFYGFPFGTTGDVAMPGDFDGDGKTDAAVFRPSSGNWFILRSSDQGVTATNFGLSGDRPITADFDGDGKSDVGIFRPSAGEWWYLRSIDQQARGFQFGTSTDRTVVGDYTGDGKSDIAFFRPATGEWFILRSEDSSFYGFPFGTAGDIPAPGDFDGDGKFDPAVFRPSAGNWFVLGSTSGVTATHFGQSGDQPIPNAFVR